MHKFSERCYAKMIFHAAKYPHLAVNGILLASKGTSDIVDAMPLFHQCLFLTPMAEIGLILIESYAERENLEIAGYYAAAEYFHDNTPDKAPASKIADKIFENNPKSCFVIIDNKLMTLGQEVPAMKVFDYSADSGRWIKADFRLLQSETTLQTVAALLQRGAMKDIQDFDNYLDNPENDWTNEFLNRDLQQIMAMY